MGVWEAERHDWPNLKGANATVTRVPAALEMLRTASSEEAATDAYWRIDNTVVVQGALYGSALPTAACVVSMLATCTPVSRVRLLELLEQISFGEPGPDDEHLLTRIREEVARGFGVYVGLLQFGTDMERELCVDLIIACAEANQALRNRVRFYLERLSSDSTASSRVRDYTVRRIAGQLAEW